MAQVEDDSEEETDPVPEDDLKAPGAKAQNGMGGEGADLSQKRKEEKDRAHKERLRDRRRRKNHLDWFRMQAQDLQSEVGDRIDELEGLRESAKSTAQSVSRGSREK